MKNGEPPLLILQTCTINTVSINHTWMYCTCTHFFYTSRRTAVDLCQRRIKERLQKYSECLECLECRVSERGGGGWLLIWRGSTHGWLLIVFRSTWFCSTSQTSHDAAAYVTLHPLLEVLAQSQRTCLSYFLDISEHARKVLHPGYAETIIGAQVLPVQYTPCKFYIYTRYIFNPGPIRRGVAWSPV